MVLNDECIIGKKGEILPKKLLRKLSGISPGDKVYIEALPGKLVIRKIFSMEELFQRPKISKITPELLDQELAAESLSQEQMSVKKFKKIQKT